MNFKNLVQICESINTTLRIGKYTMFKDIPAEVYDYETAIKNRSIISSATSKNLKALQTFATKYKNISVVYDKVYKVNRSGARRMSTYITGKYGNSPFIYARIETLNSMAGRTLIYFEESYQQATKLLLQLSTHRLPNGIYEQVDAKGNIRRCKDEECTILHNPDGPAFEQADGVRCWYANGDRHRLDGPAVEGRNGYKEWWVNGKGYSEEDFNKLFGKYNDVADKQIVADIDTMFE